MGTKPCLARTGEVHVFTVNMCFMFQSVKKVFKLKLLCASDLHVWSDLTQALESHQRALVFEDACFTC